MRLGRLEAIPRSVQAPVDRAELAAPRDRWLRRLLAHAYRHVPLHRGAMDAVGLTPDAVRTAADLARVPLLAKRDYRDAGGDALADGVAPTTLLDHSTSGSTGERMVVKRTWFEERLLNAFRWRALLSYGYTPTGAIAGIEFRVTRDRHDRRPGLDWLRRLGLFRLRSFDGLTDPHLASAVEAYAPQVVVGMASVLARLADLTAAGGYRIRPRFVVSGGELLTEPLRRRIRAFGVPIHDVYGCNELNLIAWQCPAGAPAFHLCDDAHVVELLDGDGRPVAEGEWGEVVATSLFSYAMPLIRYRVGDTAVRGPERCECGAAFSTLLAIRGRTIDLFPLPDGGSLHPWEIMNAIREQLGWVRQIQFVQTMPATVELRVVPQADDFGDDAARLLASARAAVGGRLQVQVRAVARIEPDASGKTPPFLPLSRRCPPLISGGP